MIDESFPSICIIIIIIIIFKVKKSSFKRRPPSLKVVFIGVLLKKVQKQITEKSSRIKSKNSE